MITRKIGKLLRGKSTPFQVYAACILGSMIAFVPGFGQAPGLMLALILALVILNANLGVAALAGVGAKLLALVLTPVSFAAGRFLLHGPTEGLFKVFVNAPVLAYFGFEYYTVTGGLLMGVVVGVIAGVLLMGFIKAFRKKMASLEEGSPGFVKLTNNKVVKVLLFVFVGGGKGKKSYADLLEKKIGNPIRPIGAAFALIVVALVVVGYMFAAEPVATAMMRRGLEKANGATVDLTKVELDLGAGKMRIEGLAMADPNKLTTDLLRSVVIEADLSNNDLLRKRITFDRIELSGASTGEERATPGVLIGKKAQPSKPPSDTPEDAKTIEDYIAKGKQWQARLTQVRDWIDKVGSSNPAATGADGEPGAARETLSERLAREIRAKGYNRVRADHLIDGAPMLLIRELVIDGMVVATRKGETFDILAKNLSTQPWLQEGAPSLTAESSSGDLAFAVTLGRSAKTPTDAPIMFRMNNISADEIAAALKTPEPLLVGGTVDLLLDGNMAVAGGAAIDLPLKVTIRNTTLNIPGVGSTDISELTIPIALKGPIDNPAITISDEALQAALIQAGKDELARQLGGEAGKLVEEASKALEDSGIKINEEDKKKATDALKGLFGGKKDDG